MLFSVLSPSEFVKEFVAQL